MAQTKSGTFEESMDRLQTIVTELESNTKPLDETIALFEEGLKLVKECDTQLKSFESRVDQLVKDQGEQNADQ